MNLIEIPQPPSKTSARNKAENLVIGLNQSLMRRIEDHVTLFTAFWGGEETPDEILAELNALGGAGILLASASENIDHIARLAAIVGKTVTDFLPEDQWVPRRAFVPGKDGVMTLAPPAEGYDAWGRQQTEGLEAGGQGLE